jgi:hypothetical protein
MARARIASAAVLVALASACASLQGRLDWRRADGSYDPVQLRDDVYECEYYTAANDGRGGRFFSGENARAWGGWGNRTFEWCMQRKAWVLTNVDAGGAAGDGRG